MTEFAFRAPPYRRFKCSTTLYGCTIDIWYIVTNDPETPGKLTIKWWLDGQFAGAQLDTIQEIMLEAIAVADAARPIHPGY